MSRLKVEMLQEEENKRKWKTGYIGAWFAFFSTHELCTLCTTFDFDAFAIFKIITFIII